MKIELNIGLNQGRNRYPVHTAIFEVVKVLAWQIVDSRVLPGDDEDCLAILAETSQSPAEIKARVELLAVRLKQECIAIHCDAFSENIGPRPWQWIPEYFRRVNGTRLESPQTKLNI